MIKELFESVSMKVYSDSDISEFITFKTVEDFKKNGSVGELFTLHDNHNITVECHDFIELYYEDDDDIENYAEIIELLELAGFEDSKEVINKIKHIIENLNI